MPRNGKLPLMRDIPLTEEVSVTMPAWAWCFFIAECANNDGRMIDWVAEEAKYKLYHPTTISEQEAKHQAMHDQQEMMQKHAFGMMGLPMNPHEIPGEDDTHGFLG